MKIVKSSEVNFVPASHEDTVNPEVWKKVLLTHKDLMRGSVQMINWAILSVGNTFKEHYHESMEEVFIILSGQVNITVGTEITSLVRGDAVVIPARIRHKMHNSGKIPVEYIVIGITQNKEGKTVVV